MREDLKRVQNARLPGQDYQRTTSSTQRTGENLRRIIDFIRDNPRSTQGDVADMLSYSMSGTRKYMYTLEKADVVVIGSGTSKSGMYQTPCYSLTADTEKLEKFIAQAKALAPEPSKKQRGSAFRKMLQSQLMPGTMVHLTIDDDELFNRKPAQNEKVEVKRHWLDVALFGDGPAPSLTAEATA